MRRLVRCGAQIIAATVLFLFVAAAAAAVVGASLQQALGHAGPDPRLKVIVSFEGDGAPTAGQVAQHMALTGVHSLWLNERLAHENDGSAAA